MLYLKNRDLDPKKVSRFDILNFRPFILWIRNSDKKEQNKTKGNKNRLESTIKLQNKKRFPLNAHLYYISS